MKLGIFILNHNGRSLLTECLPSVQQAADASAHDTRVVVVDNASTDDSLAWLAATYPEVEVISRPNRGLCSFNDILSAADEQVAVLLNNDIKLDRQSLDPWIAPLDRDSPSYAPNCFLTAPLCWRFDGRTYEGFRTGLRWRWGLVQATALFPGHEPAHLEPGPIASAGAAIAVNRCTFLALGGFDPLYLPGRIEDLDLAYRAYRLGYEARYVPQAVAWHRGQASFDAEMGSAASLRLALRNTLLFQWRHLRHPVHIARHVAALPVRVVFDVVRAPWQPPAERFGFCRALAAAAVRAPAALRQRSVWSWTDRERDFFRQFDFRRMAATAEERRRADSWARDEASRWARHPVSRWYVCPWACRLAERLAGTSVRPKHVTLVGLVCGLAAALAVACDSAAAPLAALLVWASWFCDRVDGPLARRQQTASPRGAWFDAQSDELLDLAQQAALGVALARQGAGLAAGSALVAFLVGKYLLMHGLAGDPPASGAGAESTSEPGWLRRLYHLPGNADVRVHLLLAALVTGWLLPELMAVACYYNVRWIVRFGRALSQTPSPIKRGLEA